MYSPLYFTLLQCIVFISTWLLLANVFFMFISFSSIVFSSVSRELGLTSYYFVVIIINFIYFFISKGLEMLEMFFLGVISSVLSSCNKKLT